MLHPFLYNWALPIFPAKKTDSYLPFLPLKLHFFESLQAYAAPDAVLSTPLSVFILAAVLGCTTMISALLMSKLRLNVMEGLAQDP